MAAEKYSGGTEGISGFSWGRIVRAEYWSWAVKTSAQLYRNLTLMLGCGQVKNGFNAVLGGNQPVDKLKRASFEYLARLLQRLRLASKIRALNY